MEINRRKKAGLFFLAVTACVVGFLAYAFYAGPQPSTRTLSASVEPFKIKVGETQTTRIELESRYGIEKVTASIPFEGGADEISLSLVSGDKKKGVWEGKWVCHNTLTKEYTTTITITDRRGYATTKTATWWDDTETVWLQGWSDRERIILTENSGSNQTNYKTRIILSYDDRMQPDFDDIRFTSADGSTLLGYYLESKTDSSTATFWATVPSLPASADTSIYYYFGNPTASSLSDAGNAPSVGDSIYYWTETSGNDFADGTFSSALAFGSGADAYIGLGPGSGQYAFEKPITVTNNTSNALTDYQVKLTLDTAALISAGKMQSDCDDMRFYESDRSTSINYYLDSGCNSVSTIVYLKTSLSASSSKTVYIYYGNTASTSGSSGANTFLLYDDLESGTLDTTNKWTLKTTYGTPGIRTDYKQGSYSVGILQTIGGGIAYYDQSHFFTKLPLTSIPVGSSIDWKGYTYRWKTTAWGGHFGGFGIGGTSTDPTSEIQDVPSDSWIKHEWFITRTATDGWQFIYYRDDAYIDTFTRTKTYSTNFEFGIQTRHNNASDNSIGIVLDNVTIRQYVSSEPTCSVGTESMRSFSYTSSGTYISHVLDVGAQSKFDSLDMTVTAPTNTTIKFQIAANNDNATWSYVGPAGTGSDYYTADSTTFPSSLQGKRFLRYKAYLDSTDSSATPQLNAIGIGYLNVAGEWEETSTTDFSDGTFANTAAADGSLRLATGVGFEWDGPPSSTWDIPVTDSGNVNEFAAPALADLDNDGDLDALEGNITGYTYAYENTGSATEPAWTAKSSWNLPDTGDYSMPAFADLDNDGDYDVLIGDQTGVCFAYENTGTASSPTWTAKPSWNSADVGGNSAPSFADLDNDGDYDLVIGETSGISYAYKNTGTASAPTWTAQASWNLPDIGVTSAPTFSDIDGDGDFDVEIGSEASYIYAYKNTGTASAPTWTSMSYWDGARGVMYCTPCFADINNDGYDDLIVGGRELEPLDTFLNDPVTFYGTSGNYTTPSGTYISSSLDITTTAKLDSLFFNITTPTNTTAKFQIAVNNDNSTWNFVGPDNTASTYYDATTDIPTVRLLGYRYMRYKAYLETTDVETTSSVQDVAINYTKTWQQTSTADFSGGTLTNVTANSDKLTLTSTGTADPVWAATSGWNTADLGTYSTTALADLDNDGDLDLMSGQTGGTSLAYKNTGSSSSPTWTAQTSWNLVDIGGRASPAFGDLDGDGDYDVMIGSTTGPAYCYKNTGSASSPTWTATAGWDSPDPGSYTNPTLADLDNDGDLDLLMGDSSGITYAYENTGSASSPTWTAKSAWNVADIGSNAAPTLKDLDSDGDYDLMIGSSTATVYGYKNTGSASSPTWTATTGWNLTATSQTYTDPEAGDLNGDGDYDLMVGTNAGTVYGYANNATLSYSASGNLVSSALDGSASLNYGFIYFTKTSATGTTLKFQLATNGDNSTWSFTGPDDTASTYYTADTEMISPTRDQNRYAKYKAYLETTKTFIAPTLYDFAIGYCTAPLASSGTPPTVALSGQLESRPRAGGSGGPSGGAFMGF